MCFAIVLLLNEKLFLATVFEFVYVITARKKSLISKQNNYMPQGNKKLFLATVFEFVYVITALDFNYEHELATYCYCTTQKS